MNCSSDGTLDSGEDCNNCPQDAGGPCVSANCPTAWLGLTNGVVGSYRFEAMRDAAGTPQLRVQRGPSEAVQGACWGSAGADTFSFNEGTTITYLEGQTVVLYERTRNAACPYAQEPCDTTRSTTSTGTPGDPSSETDPSRLEPASDDPNENDDSGAQVSATPSKIVPTWLVTQTATVFTTLLSSHNITNVTYDYDTRIIVEMVGGQFIIKGDPGVSSTVGSAGQICWDCTTENCDETILTISPNVLPSCVTNVACGPADTFCPIGCTVGEDTDCEAQCGIAGDGVCPAGCTTDPDCDATCGADGGCVEECPDDPDCNTGQPCKYEGESCTSDLNCCQPRDGSDAVCNSEDFCEIIWRGCRPEFARCTDNGDCCSDNCELDGHGGQCGTYIG